MASHTVLSKGIFHGLPTFPEYDGKKLSIIVTGANGISGSAMVKVLSEAPERWDKVYALSRRPGTYPASSNIVSIAVDFLDSTPEAIAKVLKDHHVKALYCSNRMHYLIWSGANKEPQGIHLGPTSTPMDEADPRHGIEGPICPRALEFPGDIPAWDVEKHQSTAILIAYHAEWALLTPDAGNTAFNHSDSSMFSWGKFWPILADWYHIPAGRPATDPAAYATTTLPYKTSPRGFGGPGVVKPSFSFLEWSKDPEVLKAWEELKAKHGLKDSPFGEKAKETFGLIDGEISGSWGRVVAMDRSRKLGWHGYVDTKEAIKGVIDDMAKLKMVPPLK